MRFCRIVIAFFLVSYCARAQTTSPSSVPNLCLWLMADSVEVVSGKVVTLYDIQNNNDAKQITPLLQPLFIDSVVNGHPVIRFDGGQTRLVGLQEITNINNSSFTIFIVASGASVSNQTIECLFTINNYNDGFWLARRSFVGEEFITSYNNGLNSITTTVNSFPNTGCFPRIITYKKEFNVVSSFYQNGTNHSNSSDAALCGPFTNTNYSVGQSGFGFTNLTGDIAEIIVYNTALSDSLRKIVEQYLSAKYAPPVVLEPSVLNSANFCPIILTPVNPNNNVYSYLWSTGETNDSITITNPGTYWIQATNIFGQTSYDTLIVTFPTLPPYTGNNIICQYSSSVWNTNLPKDSFSFLWSDNSTDSILTITMPGQYNVKVTDTSGCFIYSDTITIVVDSFPSIVSLGPDLSLCAGNPITLLAGEAANLTYLWNDNSINDSLIIDSSGTYSITVKNTNNCIATDSINITIVGQAPSVGFQNTLACKNTLVSFMDTSIAFSGNIITQWYWDFGDTTIVTDTSNISNPNYTYTENGVYTINLLVTTNVGCQQSLIKNITVYSSPTIELGADTVLCAGNFIFPLSQSGNGLTYLWNDNTINDSIMIGLSGIYVVEVTNGDNCKIKDSISVIVPGEAPTANFSNSIACHNSITSFLDLSLPPSGDTITNWSWDFGNIITVDDTSDIQNSSYTYVDTGAYTINLTVTTNVGCKQSITKNIHVYPKPIVDFTNAIACQNDTTFFTNAITTLGYPISTYLWDFGDTINNSSATANPFHIFSQNTNYQVTLTATNNQGCVNFITKPVTVKDEVSADFTYSTSCVGVPVLFSDNSIVPAPNNMNTRQWNFFPGTATGLNPTKTYTVADTFLVKLAVIGINGCNSSITKQIIVHTPPVANFNTPVVCEKDSFIIQDNSLPQNGTLTAWQWKIDGVVFSAMQNPGLIINTVSNPLIQLITQNSFGCVDSITKTVVVNPLPDAGFSLSPPAYYYINDPVTIVPNTLNAASYNWIVSNGDIFVVASPVTTFTANNTYSINFEITDGLGCKNTSSQNIIVVPRNKDLGIISVNSTIDVEGFVSVNTNLINYGSTLITQFEVSYEISGAGIIKEIWTGSLLPGTGSVYTFTGKIALKNNKSENAVICVKIRAVNGVPTDDNLLNNEMCGALYLDKTTVSDIYPNPSEGDATLAVVLTDNQNIVINVYDNLGRLIFENLNYEGVKGLNIIKIPSATLSSGNYTTKVQVENAYYLRRLIKSSAK